MFYCGAGNQSRRPQRGLRRFSYIPLLQYIDLINPQIAALNIENRQRRDIAAYVCDRYGIKNLTRLGSAPPPFLA